MTTDDTLARYRPDTRPAETYASTVTSADTKLAYNHDEDRFEAILVGDINANPEGLMQQDDWQGALYDDGRTLLDVVADGYVHNMQQMDGDSGTVAYVAHPATWDGDWVNESSYLTQDKQAIYDAVADAADVDTVVPVQPDAITANGHGITVDGDPVDGYVNVYDQGDALLDALGRDIDAIAAGANAPTAVWNVDEAVQPYTDKSGLLATAAEVASDTDTVHTPGYDRVETLDDVLAFLDEQDGRPVVVKSDPTGTWGDHVVGVDADAAYDDVLTTLREKESEVQAKANRPDDFAIIDDDGRFVQDGTSHEYGVVEEAIAGDLTRDGDRYTVFDIDGKPVDFVPLATYDPSTGDAEVYNVTVRASKKTDLNANCGFRNFTITSLADAFESVNGTALQDELEAVAGRPVTYDEIRAPLEQAGAVAFATRNASAFKAEQALEDGGGTTYAD